MATIVALVIPFPCSVKTSFLIIVCMIGVVMVVDPNALASDLASSNVTITAQCMAFTAALVSALAFMIIRQSNSSMHFIKMCFWFNMFGITTLTLFMVVTVAVLSSKGQPYDWVIRSVDTTEWIYAIGIAVICAIAQITLTSSAQIINTTVMSLIKNLDIIFTMLFQVLYFKEIPSSIQVAGIIIMVLSTIGVIIVKEMAGRDDAK